MNIQDKISINAHYTRSVNLERDTDSIEVVNAYILTSRARRTLSCLFSTFHGRQAPRAWSLVGPYGSGKSSFAVFLSHLLATDGAAETKAAQKTLKTADPGLYKQFIQDTKGSKGYLKVLITGAPEPMAKRLVQGILEAAEKRWRSIKGRNPAILAELEASLAAENLSASTIVNLVKKLQVQLVKTDCKGILLVIDELGKFFGV